MPTGMALERDLEVGQYLWRFEDIGEITYPPKNSAPIQVRVELEYCLDIVRVTRRMRDRLHDDEILRCGGRNSQVTDNRQSRAADSLLLKGQCAQSHVEVDAT